jgi:hypothetical protein
VRASLQILSIFVWRARPDLLYAKKERKQARLSVENIFKKVKKKLVSVFDFQ